MSELPVSLEMTEEHRRAILERVTDALLNGTPVYLDWNFPYGRDMASFEVRFKAVGGVKVSVKIDRTPMPREDIEA